MPALKLLISISIIGVIVLVGFVFYWIIRNGLHGYLNASRCLCSRNGEKNRANSEGKDSGTKSALKAVTTEDKAQLSVVVQNNEIDGHAMDDKRSGQELGRVESFRVAQEYVEDAYQSESDQRKELIGTIVAAFVQHQQRMTKTDIIAPQSFSESEDAAPGILNRLSRVVAGKNGE